MKSLRQVFLQILMKLKFQWSSSNLFITVENVLIL